MSIAITPNDPRVRIYAKGTWTDVYRKVRQSDGKFISIQMGNENEALGDEINPGICELTFHNNDGWFTPNNPMSPFFPDLEVETPLCVLSDDIRDFYSRTASNTWGDTTTGETYVTKSVGGTIAATDYSTNGLVGIHSVPAVSSYRMSYFDDTSGAPTAYNLTQKIRYTPTFTNVTGGNIEVANLQCRLQDDSNYYMLRAEVTTAEEITLKILRVAGGDTTLAGPITVSGISHTIGQPIWFELGAFDDQLFATAWQGDSLDDEPTGWLLSATDNSFGYGRYGVRSGVASGNTNAKPILFHYDYYTVYVSDFNGEIPDFPQEFSDDGVDMVVPIVAGGVLRRYAESKAPRKTALRYFYETEMEDLFSGAPDYYWPLDDGELSNEGRPTVGASSAPFHFNFALGILGGVDTSREKHFSQAKLGSWMPNGVNVLQTEIFQALPQAGTANITTGRWVADWVRTGGANTIDTFSVNGFLSPGVFIGGINGDIFSIDFNAVNQEITVNPGLLESAVVIDATTLETNVFDGAAHHYRLYVNVTNVDDLHWQLTIDDNFVDDAIIADHPLLASVGAVYMSGQGTEPSGYAHVAIFTTTDPFSSISTAFLRFTGSLGEPADTRAARLANEANITQFITTNIGMEMGPQFEGDTFFEQFQELTRTDGGILRELMSARAIHYDPLTTLRTRPVSLTLDVGAVQLAQAGFRPVRDTLKLRNKIVASKREGGDYTYEKTIGRLGTADPKSGGAGVKEGKTSVNPELDSQLIHVAQREVSEGTIDKSRYPEISVDLMADIIRNNVGLRRQILDAFISTRIKLTNMQRWHIYEDADLLVIGHKRILSPYEHKITWNTIPFTSLDTFHVETAGSILGTNSSYITSDETTSSTDFDVNTDGHALWTTNAGSMPITAKIEGEDISITNIVTNAPTFRSVGTASHADNASTSPGLPTGHTAGDTLICFSVIRNTAGTANTPAGYASLTTTSHYNISSKVDNGAEVVPTCTYSGGAAGDTTSSFIIALPNCPQFHASGNISTNSSAQDITYPSCTLPRWNGIILLFAWKQDDFTSIAVPLGLTEIIEASTTTGNDQSLYAAYLAAPQPREDFQSGSLVVTGGASAISKAIILYFTNPQRFTVTRNLNGLPGGKAHTANTPIKIAYPKVLG